MIDMSAFKGVQQKFVEPIIKPKVLKPDFTKVEFLEVDASSECHITPADIAGEMVEYLNLENDSVVCEPSFGTSRLLDALLDYGHDDGLITGIERSQELFKHCKKDIELINCDFLEYEDKSFDRFLMNPPFQRGLALKHIKKAHSLLRVGGEIIAIVPVTFKHGYTIRTLESGTFELTKAMTKIISISYDYSFDKK